MTDPLTYADLERRYDAAIPQDALDRLRHGSATKAAIVRTEDSIVFFRDLIMRTGPSARKWRIRKNEKMVKQNIGDGWLYFREWRKLRARLNDLRGTSAAVKGAGRFFDALNPKEPGDG